MMVITLNTLYLHASSHSKNRPYLTSVHVACSAADGLPSFSVDEDPDNLKERAIVNKIFDKFETLGIKKVDTEGNEIGSLLKYYGMGTGTGDWFFVKDLLEHEDGRCGAWGLFFQETLNVMALMPILVWVLNP
ncbi:hypothetical protein BVX99_02760 [bacterium F16]|nr:hypothetical protein BVX99_02760 [bacterium F16]